MLFIANIPVVPKIRERTNILETIHLNKKNFADNRKVIRYLIALSDGSIYNVVKIIDVDIDRYNVYKDLRIAHLCIIITMQNGSLNLSAIFGKFPGGEE